MDIFFILVSLLFIILAEYFIYKAINRVKDEQAIILIIVLLFVTVFIALFIINVVVYYKTPLLRPTTKDKILEMVNYLLIGGGSVYLYNKYLNKNNK